MKSNLTFSLRGSDWWKPFLPYWLLFIAEEVSREDVSDEAENVADRLAISTIKRTM
jgi:hypothetical protein